MQPSGWEIKLVLFLVDVVIIYKVLIQDICSWGKAVLVIFILIYCLVLEQ